MTLFKSILLGATACLAAATLTGTTAALAEADGHTANASPAFTLDMKRGEVLQVIVSQQRADGREAARTYGQAAFPLAQRHGYARIGQLNVRQTIRSDFAPQAVSFFSWPSQAALDSFSAEPDWPAIKATRPEAWSGLDIYSAELQHDLKIATDPDKHYTVLIAWLKSDEATADYDRYLTGIEPAVERSGGRFLYKMRMPEREAYAPDATAPHQLTFVEWETTDGFEKVQQSPEYAANQQYFGSSMEKFEFYWLTTP
ncbi:hypothetical protein CD351_13005 [Erythrobacter sp. KY5]|uniref:hypothetical protein n=1 Tax=Erythrobacter sp. KY5 TaxID=2011159 RepID=UPI000DBF0A85|nr:hypothetical protein [Erythrobacter sp. KY5]AWW75348.1 hypothetical protein CD351_13005 [Erythrobacter sp. KY5]